MTEYRCNSIVPLTLPEIYLRGLWGWKCSGTLLQLGGMKRWLFDGVQVQRWLACLRYAGFVMRSLEWHGQLRCSGRWSSMTLSLENSLQTHCNRDMTYANQLQVNSVNTIPPDLKCLCSLVLIVKLPAVGFIQATYWTLLISLSVIFCRSYQWV